MELSWVELVLLSVVLYLYYVSYVSRVFSHWALKGVPHLRGYLGAGSMWRVVTQREHPGQFFQRIYREHKDEPFLGFYQGSTPSLLVRDPELIKNILIKDFSYFTDHGFKLSFQHEPLMARNVFTIEGDPWRETRFKLAPVFTSGIMKNQMFPRLLETAGRLGDKIQQLATSGEHVELKELMLKYTAASGGLNFLGISSEDMFSETSALNHMNKMYDATNFLHKWNIPSILYWPGMADALGITIFKRGCEDHFRSLFRDLINLRTSSKQAQTEKGPQPGKKGDFLDLLIRLKEQNWAPQGSEVHPVTGFAEELTAQAFIFLFAAFETTSIALFHALSELAHQPAIQKKARDAIREVIDRHGGQVTYQAVHEMEYLDWILDESLRLYPPVPHHFRSCTRNYTIPGTKVHLEAGTRIIIPVFALQRDPAYFPDPERFNPERFKDLRSQAQGGPDGVYKFVFAPFGEGPRQCIGMRFARLSFKIAMMTILRDFEVTPHSPSEPPQISRPDLKKRWFLLVARDKKFVNFTKINQ